MTATTPDQRCQGSGDRQSILANAQSTMLFIQTNTISVEVSWAAVLSLIDDLISHASKRAQSAQITQLQFSNKNHVEEFMLNTSSDIHQTILPEPQRRAAPFRSRTERPSLRNREL